MTNYGAWDRKARGSAVVRWTGRPNVGFSKKEAVCSRKGLDGEGWEGLSLFCS